MVNEIHNRDIDLISKKYYKIIHIDLILIKYYNIY
jgi:hypothetical protein